MSTDTAHTTTPRIYVACLAAYNAGILHGAWIDCDQGDDHIWQELRDMLARSPEPNAEEWAIHDFEGFGEHPLSEWESIADVARIAEAICEHGEPFLAALGIACDFEQAESLMQNYYGEYDSDESFTMELLEDTGGLPGDLPSYLVIDWTATAKAIMMDFHEHAGHYFHAH